MDRAKGLTLPELTTALAVLAIGAALAWPGFSSAVLRAKGTTALHLLGTSLASARMAAVSRRSPVTVCPSADGRRCRKDSVWEDGWTIYRDRPERDQPESPEHVLNRVTIARNAFPLLTTSGHQRIRNVPGRTQTTKNPTILPCARRAQR